MKKVIYICSFLCGITAFLLFIFGIRAITGYRYYIGLRIFYMASSGAITGVIGNLLGLAVSCLGFGALAVYGFMSSQKAKKNSFIYGLIMTGICFASLVSAFVTRTANLGDLYFAALPAIYTFAVLKSA
ncbi:MAG: hypothetical protein J1E40_09600 [Oscillospiraceae bacterium]|nr:hypothetical protein [Oscillospiraceae bacterium]